MDPERGMRRQSLQGIARTNAQVPDSGSII
jgi:hypothetical protein